MDQILLIEGRHPFTLINPKWDEPNHVILKNQAMGAMKKPHYY